MKSCLIVDDSRVVRKVAGRIIQDFGFTCREAENGLKAVELCQIEMPDVIVLDWNMPVMSGIEFLEKLRQMENGASPKVVMCTMESDTDHIRRAVAAGANEYIVKPFDREVFRTKFMLMGVLEY